MASEAKDRLHTLYQDYDPLGVGVVDRQILDSPFGDEEEHVSAVKLHALTGSHAHAAGMVEYDGLLDQAFAVKEPAQPELPALSERAKEVLRQCSACACGPSIREDVETWTMAKWLALLKSAEGSSLADVVAGGLSSGLDVDAQYKFVRALGEANDVDLISYFCVTSGLLDELARFVLHGARELLQPRAPARADSQPQLPGLGELMTPRALSRGCAKSQHLTEEVSTATSSWSRLPSRGSPEKLDIMVAELKESGLSPAEAKELLGDDVKGGVARALLSVGLREKRGDAHGEAGAQWSIGEEVVVRYDDGSAGFYRVRAVCGSRVRTDYAMEFDVATGEGLYAGRKLRKAFSMEWA